MKNRFRVVAPQGQRVSFRHIVDACGTPVLAIQTGEYLPRLGNMRESYVRLIEGGKETKDIYCNFGGVIRAILNYLNDKKIEDWMHKDLEEAIPYLDKIKQALVQQVKP